MHNRAFLSKSVSLTPQNRAANLLTDRSLGPLHDAKSVTSTPLDAQNPYAANPTAINQDIEQHQPFNQLNQTMPIQ